MLQDGGRGITGIPVTGEVFGGTILIGVDTALDSITAADSTIGTIEGAAPAGIEDSAASPLERSTPADASQVLLQRSPTRGDGLLSDRNKSLSSAARKCTTRGVLSSVARKCTTKSGLSSVARKCTTRGVLSSRRGADSNLNTAGGGGGPTKALIPTLEDKLVTLGAPSGNRSLSPGQDNW